MLVKWWRFANLEETSCCFCFQFIQLLAYLCHFVPTFFWTHFWGCSIFFRDLSISGAFFFFFTLRNPPQTTTIALVHLKKCITFPLFWWEFFWTLFFGGFNFVGIPPQNASYHPGNEPSWCQAGRSKVYYTWIPLDILKIAVSTVFHPVKWGSKWWVQINHYKKTIARSPEQWTIKPPWLFRVKKRDEILLSYVGIMGL